MNNLVSPLSQWTPDLSEHFDLEDSDDVIGVAKRLIDGQHPGVLTTIDENGRPHARWMATLAFSDFPVIHTLTAPDSRKIAHIKAHPDVEWMFSNQDLTFILNLSGTAEVLTDTRAIKHIWKKIEDKSHAYFLHNFVRKPGFSVIETKVRRISGCIPQSSLAWAIDTESLMPSEKK